MHGEERDKTIVSAHQVLHDTYLSPYCGSELIMLCPTLLMLSIIRGHGWTVSDHVIQYGTLIHYIYLPYETQHILR